MKALKIMGKVLGGLVAVIVAAVVIVYFGWLSPPSPESVCDNLAQITKKESGADLPDSVRKSCLADASRSPQFGRAIWVKQLKCMRDASTSSEIKACSRSSAL